MKLLKTTELGSKSCPFSFNETHGLQQLNYEHILNNELWLKQQVGQALARPSSRVGECNPELVHLISRQSHDERFLRDSVFTLKLLRIHQSTMSLCNGPPKLEVSPSATQKQLTSCWTYDIQMLLGVSL